MYENTLKANFLQSEVCVFLKFWHGATFVAGGCLWSVHGVRCFWVRHYVFIKERKRKCDCERALTVPHSLLCSSLTSPRKAQEHLVASKKPDRSQTVPAVSVLPPVNGDLLSPTVSAVLLRQQRLRRHLPPHTLSSSLSLQSPQLTRSH